MHGQDGERDAGVQVSVHVGLLAALKPQGRCQNA